MNKTGVFAKLVSIMTLVSLLAIGITTFFLYKDEVNKQGERLMQEVARVKRMTISMVDYHIICVSEGHHPKDKDPDHVKTATIKQLHDSLTGLPPGDIEITVGYLRNKQIWWISQSFAQERLYVPIQMGHIWAIPMQLALQQKAGLIRDKDYGGNDVLAAYDYVKSIEVGIVAKIYMSSIYDRFVRGAFFACIPAVLLIFLGVAAFIWVSNPIVAQLEKDNEELRLLTDEKLAIEKVHQALVQSVPGMIYMGDEFWSAKIIGGSDLIGYSEEEINALPNRWLDIIHPKDRQAIFNESEGMNDIDGELVQQYRIITKNRKTRWVEDRKVLTRENDKTTVTGIVFDITSRVKSNERLKQAELHEVQISKMEAIGNFASGIAHDFNNALTPIVGRCDVLLYEMGKSNKCRRHILEILAAAETAARLVKRIQSYTRKGSAELQATNTLRLGGCLKETFEFLRSMIPKSIEMEIEIDPNLGLVKASDISIRQILMNLCKNSAQAMGNDIGKIRIGATNDRVFTRRYGIPQGNYVRIEVEDNGHGMSREIIEKALDPYFTTKEFGEGTGIGLSVVSGIVGGYNGFVRLYSEENKGTTILIYLPIVKDTGQKIVECKMDEEIPMGEGEHILLVDDEEAIIDAISRTLESLNYKVTGYKSSLKAFEDFALDPEKYDVLITDLTMPEMTGLTLIKEIKNIKPEIKIVLCSGLGSNGDNLEDVFGDSLGVYMTKPVTRRGYGEILAKILGRS